MFKKVAIIGVGLIGGSIGKALRKNRLAKEVIGIGRRRSSLDKAKKVGAVNSATLNLKKGVTDSDLIIVATPVDLVIKKIAECAKFAKRGAIIIDVTSVKKDIVKAADKILKKSKGIYFVGTHPMAGSEESGCLVSRADLFKKSICIITPSKSTNKNALLKIKRLWQSLGARVEIMRPEAHDIAVAGISHLPHLLAYSLCASVSGSDMTLAGSGFRDATRIAKSNPKMWAEIFMHNKASILKAKRAFDKEVVLLQRSVAKANNNKLLKRLTLAKCKRDRIG